MSNTEVPAEVNVVEKTIHVNTPGGKLTVQMNDDDTVASALERNGVDISRLGLDVLLGDQRHDASEVTGAQLRDGQSLAAPPKNAALGA